MSDRMTDEQALEMFYGELDGWHRISEEYTGQGRWQTYTMNTYKNETTGQLYGVEMATGSTEMQEDSDAVIDHGPVRASTKTIYVFYGDW